MQIELRLAALTKLVASKSEAAAERLGREFAQVEAVLTGSTQFAEIRDTLKILAVLAPRFHQAVVPLLLKLVRDLPTRNLLDGETPIQQARSSYWSPYRLVLEAIEVAEEVQYVHTEDVAALLFELAASSNEDVKNKAETNLEKLASFNLDIFFTHKRGAEPQLRLLAQLAGFSAEQLSTLSGAVLRLLRAMLSPSMEGAAWSYNTLTIRRGNVVSAGGVAEVRDQAISLLEKMYFSSDAVTYRAHVLSTFDTASRRLGAAGDAESFQMFERDAIRILTFMRDLVATEALPLVQKIEHQAYWDFYHAMSPAVEQAALAVRDAVAKHTEYGIFKNLIGFEGIFGDWERLKREPDAWDYSDHHRHVAARRYLDGIDDDSWPEWRARLLEFCKTRSVDLASFPVFYEFLENLSRERPLFGLELVRENGEAVEPFLIALLRGLWESAQSEVTDQIATAWVQAGLRLSVVAKSLYKSGGARLELLAAIVNRARELDDRQALVTLLGVAASLHGEGVAPAKAVFLQALRALADKGDVSWATDAWLGRDLRAIVASLEFSEQAELLTTLLKLPSLDYRAEEILFAIGKTDARAVLDFFLQRLKMDRAARNAPSSSGDPGDDEAFEPIPYQFHRLNNVLAEHPDSLVEAVRRDYQEENARVFFTFRGARLAKAVFPQFEAPLEQALRKILATKKKEDIDFVVSVLRAYDGSQPVLDLCKDVVKVAPEMSDNWNQLAATLETTGVVSGEYGLVRFYEARIADLAPWINDDDARVRAFALWLTAAFERTVEREKQRADDSLAWRKYRYGTSDDGDHLE